MHVYFADLGLRVADPSVAEQVSRADAVIYDSANGHTTVTSHLSGFAASQGDPEFFNFRFSKNAYMLNLHFKC